MRRRDLIIAAAGLSLAASAATAAPAPIGGPFRLMDQHGRPTTERDLLGRPSLVFFGYTFCPEVCPTTLTKITRWLRLLGPQGARLNVFFVTVDPERDTQKQLGEYLSAFDPRIRGLTGAPAEIARMAKAYRVYYRREPTPGGSYLMDHSTTVYLMDGAGRFVEPIAYNEPEGMALDSLRRLVR